MKNAQSPENRIAYRHCCGFKLPGNSKFLLNFLKPTINTQFYQVFLGFSMGKKLQVMKEISCPEHFVLPKRCKQKCKYKTVNLQTIANYIKKQKKKKNTPSLT